MTKCDLVHMRPPTSAPRVGANEQVAPGIAEIAHKDHGAS